MLMTASLNLRRFSSRRIVFFFGYDLGLLINGGFLSSSIIASVPKKKEALCRNLPLAQKRMNLVI